MQERIQKMLAQAGLGSRRHLEGLIREGRIIINDEVAQLGQRITGAEHILIDGKRVHLKPQGKQSFKVIAYHKPVGEICSNDDPDGRKRVFDALPKLKNGRWISVGRLDVSTSGLLLFTNDGELAHRLMHPSQEIEREYAVRILGEVDNPMLARLIKGVELDDGVARFTAIEFSGGTGANQWFHVILKEGRTREVRRLWESQGVTISRLTRVRYGPVILERKLRKGQSRELNEKEVNQLYKVAGLHQAEPNMESKEPRRT